MATTALEAFKDNVDIAIKIGQLVDEIAAACEQAEGLARSARPFREWTRWCKHAASTKVCQCARNCAGAEQMKKASSRWWKSYRRYRFGSVIYSFRPLSRLAKKCFCRGVVAAKEQNRHAEDVIHDERKVFRIFDYRKKKWGLFRTSDH